MQENIKYPEEENEDLRLLKSFDKSLSREEMVVFKTRDDYKYWSHLNESTSEILTPEG